MALPPLQPMDSYLFTVIQFSYVILFSMAFPLAAVIALATNKLQLHTDGVRICIRYRMSPPAATSDIKHWFQHFNSVVYIAVLVNTALVSITTNHIEFVIPYCQELAAENSQCLSLTAKFVVFVLLEHMMFLVLLFMHQNVPIMPTWLQTHISKQEYQIKNPDALHFSRSSFDSREFSPSKSLPPPSS